MSTELRSMEPASAKPWLAPDLLPLKPDEADYGYKRGKDLVSCTKEELIASCRPGSGLEINLVWHPDSDRLVPVSDVAFLRDALRQRAKSALSWVLAGGLLNIAGIVLARRDATPGWSDLLWVNLFVFGVLPLLQWGYDTWEFRRSQDGMDP